MVCDRTCICNCAWIKAQLIDRPPIKDLSHSVRSAWSLSTPTLSVDLPPQFPDQMGCRSNYPPHCMDHTRSSDPALWCWTLNLRTLPSGLGGVPEVGASHIILFSVHSWPYSGSISGQMTFSQNRENPASRFSVQRHSGHCQSPDHILKNKAISSLCSNQQN